MSLANFFTGEDDFADAANLYARTISTIDRLEAEGELDEEEAEESRAVSYKQYQDLLEELEAMYEAEDDEDETPTQQNSAPVFGSIDYMDKQELRNKFFELNT